MGQIPQGVRIGSGAAAGLEVVLPGEVEPQGLQLRSREAVVPSAGKVVLRMEATGVSFADQQMRRGKYYDQPRYPFVPGYDLVGTVVATGAGVDTALLGGRFAAVVKTGAWAEAVEVQASALLPVPDGLDPVAVEASTVNGITAWQMLHEVARVRPGGRVLVLGANGGVGSTLVQLARAAGVEVVGAAAVRHHGLVRRLGATPVDARASDFEAAVQAVAPTGFDAVFDHVGGSGIRISWRLLRPGGTLVSYGSAATKEVGGASRRPILRLLLRLAVWNLLPNGRSAHFYNFWSGRRHARQFQDRQAGAFAGITRLLEDGALRPQIAARFPLTEVVEALRLAESRTVAGKVIIIPKS